MGTNPMQAREGQEALQRMMTAQEDDYVHMKRKGTATRFGDRDGDGDSDADSDDGGGGSLSLQQREWFFPAYIAMAPELSLSDYGKGMKELPDEVSIIADREGLHLVAPEDTAGSQPLRSWNWVEIFSYCGSTTEEDSMDIFD